MPQQELVYTFYPFKFNVTLAIPAENGGETLNEYSRYFSGDVTVGIKNKSIFIESWGTQHGFDNHSAENLNKWIGARLVKVLNKVSVKKLLTFWAEVEKEEIITQETYKTHDEEEAREKVETAKRRAKNALEKRLAFRDKRIKESKETLKKILECEAK